MHRRWLALVTAVVLAACGDDPAARSPTDTVSPAGTSATVSATTSSPYNSAIATTIPEISPTTTTTTTEAPMSMTPAGTSLELAVADLMDRLRVRRNQITVVSAEEVTWRDGSIGCPEPGRAYTQALVAGQRIVLAVDGTEYAYHSGRGRTPFYCPSDRAEEPSPDSRT